MIVVAARASIRPEHLAVLAEAVQRVTEATRREPGCRSYTFYQELGNPCALLVHEEWESEEALAAHFETPHVKEFLEALGKMLSGPVEIVKYQVTSRERM